MKVHLIFPAFGDLIEHHWKSSFLSELLCRITGMGKTNYIPPLSLLTLAAVTPPDVEVKLVDERIEALNYDDQVDLVGISVVTRSAPRAYEIAAEYRQRGVKVVLGGIHPSAMQREAVLHADAIVLGEGESVWPEILHDTQQGNLKQIYRGDPQMDLDALPLPRRDLIRDPSMYVTTKVINATRGCPNSCVFCSAGVGLIKKYRKRSPQNVVTELEQVPGKIAIFTDDNIGWDVDYTKELFRAMIPLNIKWSSAISANALEDQELIELAARSGCFSLGVGFESTSSDVIRNIRKDKTNNPENYAELIRRVQENGIVVYGSFILGFDNDDAQSFAQLLSFIKQTSLEIADINILTPYPGSVLYREYERDGRLLHNNWRYFEPTEGACVFLPKQMTPQELMDGYLDVLEKTLSLRSVMPRLIRSPSWPSFGSLVALHFNLENRNSIPEIKIRSHQYKQDILKQYLRQK